jgi:hypothetical protein
VLHWDGKRWRTALDTGYGGTFTAVAARSANRAWVIGWADSDYGGELAYRWTGTHWVEFGPPGVAGNYLDSLSVVSERDIWAAGTTQLRDDVGIKVGPSRPLVEHYSC